MNSNDILKSNNFRVNYFKASKTSTTKICVNDAENISDLFFFLWTSGRLGGKTNIFSKASHTVGKKCKPSLRLKALLHTAPKFALVLNCISLSSMPYSDLRLSWLKYLPWGKGRKKLSFSSSYKNNFSHWANSSGFCQWIIFYLLHVSH